MSIFKEENNKITIICGCGVKHIITNDDGKAVHTQEYSEENKKKIENEKMELLKNGQTKKTNSGFFANLYGTCDEPTAE